MELINDLRAKQKEIDGLKSLVSESSDDKDMLDMAVSELGEAVEEEKRLQTLLLKSLLPKDEAGERDCILEVRAGTGGEEASLFAMDICRMYERYSQKKDGVCIQSLERTGCVWDAKFLESGDIVTACSDGVVRVWTVRDEVIADQMEIDAYNSLISIGAGKRLGE
ncbi:unnamed protein product [Microthlaspi erraticum]|uniref:Peptide chain release factor domain-containing protein n=1 Tax=Microthlaspi erraticum TaxID=1685480 RepID=A0A6D2KCB0_9BRAS|nr:unnamed protein product [Microthlaspi erraticum]